MFLGKKEQVYVLLKRLFVSLTRVSFLFFFSSSWCLGLAAVFSSSWCLGLAAVCDCDTPWTFVLTFFSRCGLKETYFLRVEEDDEADEEYDGIAD